MYIAIALCSSFMVALTGWQKGFFHLLSRLLLLLLAYLFAWQGTPYLADWLAEKGWVQGVMVWPVAGMLLFVGSSILFSSFARWLEEHWAATWRDHGRIAGGFFGALLGVGVGLLLVWTVGVLQDSWRMKQQGASAPVPAAIGVDDPGVNQAVRKLSAVSVAAVLRKTLGDGPVATATEQWVYSPLSVSEGLRYVAQKPELRQLFQDPDSYAVLVRGDNAGITELPSFRALTTDPQVMPFLVRMGLPGAGPQQQSQALAETLSRFARNYERLRNTPEFQGLVQDRELREKLAQGNLLVLLTDDKVRRLAEMLARNDLPLLPAAGADVPQQVDSANPQRPGVLEAAPVDNEPARLLYRWKDDNGHLHISDQKPSEGVPADVIQP